MTQTTGKSKLSIEMMKYINMNGQGKVKILKCEHEDWIQDELDNEATCLKCNKKIGNRL